MLPHKTWPVVGTALLLTLSISALADTIITKKGETWKGLVIRENDTEVVLDVKGVCQMPIKKADILKRIRDKKSFIELKTGEKYEYFKLIRQDDKEIAIKLDGMDEEMVIKQKLIKSKYIGPDAKEKDTQKDQKGAPRRGKGRAAKKHK
ncbi:MAG: hypothetical protein GXP25_00515 [Planctomycetes bacterium]|nr:hypothetical protein [Planctomycetota bacterium]